MPHSRTDIELDDEVLRAIPGAQYKILRYLVNRADPRGVCYPGNERIANGTSYDLRHIERLVPQLVEAGLVAYLRRKEFDPFTRRALPNVYQINPAYICIAEAHQAEAQALWDQATGKSTRLLSRTLTNTKNQYHKPTPKRETTPRTNNNNQHSAHAALNTETQGAAELSNDPTAARENDKPQSATPNSVSTAKHSNPGVPRGGAAKFVNPGAIGDTLPDNQHETLALKLRGLGIPMGMARGFVVEYGVKSCEDALIQTLAASREGTIQRPGGFFRGILQGNYIDAEIAPLSPPDGDKWDYT